MSIYLRWAVLYNCERYLQEVEQVVTIASRWPVADCCSGSNHSRPASLQLETPNQDSEPLHNGKEASDTSSVCSLAKKPDGPFRCQMQIMKLHKFHRILQALVQALSKATKRLEKEADTASSELINHMWNEAARLNGRRPVRPVSMTSVPWSDTQEETESPGPYAPVRRSPLSSTLDPVDLLWDDQLATWNLHLGQILDETGRRHYKI